MLAAHEPDRIPIHTEMRNAGMCIAPVPVIPENSIQPGFAR
jgi:hypothetical protein